MPDFVGKEMVMRSVFERLLALFLLIVLLPILFFIGLWVAVSSSGPIIFRQVRVGYKMKNFVVYKFRTMYDQPWPVKNIPGYDYRVTRLGRLLRKTHLDELPQLWNVVRGEMSFVGPRPQIVERVQHYLHIYPKRYGNRFEVLPGITGLAQIYGEKAGSKNLFENTALDELYRTRQSICLDVMIAFKTVFKMIKGTSY
jgi:undecaprenyl phosphate N,N'-diacetylbacillosamine 1-phosphate transferase